MNQCHLPQDPPMPPFKSKPPLGPSPKVIWYEQRIVELSRSIYEYVNYGDFKPIYQWADELTKLLHAREDCLESQFSNIQNIKKPAVYPVDER